MTKKLTFKDVHIGDEFTLKNGVMTWKKVSETEAINLSDNISNTPENEMYKQKYDKNTEISNEEDS